MARFLFPLLLLLACGCDETVLVVDGGPVTDASLPNGTITLESAAVLGLTFGEVAELVFVYTEDGSPVGGESLRLAFEGTAHDSSLLSLDVVTDTSGRARTSLTAGTVPAVFRVRARIDSAAPAFVNVSVGDEGFGDLVVEAVYSGRRDQVVRRTITLYSDTECDPPDGFPATEARQTNLDEVEETEVTWETLAAGLTYTVVAKALGPTGAALAVACIDDVQVAADLTTRVSVAFADAALLPDGRYETELTVRPTDATMLVTERLLDAGVGLVVGTGAGFYLDALDTELRSRGQTAAADALAVERGTGVPDTTLTANLDASLAGPLVAVAELGSRLTERLEAVRLGGPLDLVASDLSVTGLFNPDRLILGIDEPDAIAPLTLDIAALATMPTMTIEWRSDTDLLAIEGLELQLGLGTLVRSALTAEAAGSADIGVALLEGAGCEVLAAWIASQASVSGACDEACASAVCTAALGQIVTAIETAVMTADELRSRVGLDGSVALTDEDGDLVVDRLEGRGLGGDWTGSSDPVGAPLTGDLIGTRVDSP